MKLPGPVVFAWTYTALFVVGVLGVVVYVLVN